MRDRKKRGKTESHDRRLPAAAEKKLAKPPGAPQDRAAQVDDRILHELQVHQIELEMQNEELKRAQAALGESRDKYKDLYDLAPVGYFTLTGAGRIAEVNLTGAALLGVERSKLLRLGLGRFVTPEVLDRWDRHLLSVLHSADKQSCELTLQREDGSRLYARLDSIRLDRPAQGAEAGDADLAIRIAMEDITERREVDDERDVTIRLLALANAQNDLHSLMKQVTLLLREWSGCQAVGIRLRSGEDYPYFETRGFPAEFVQAENSLCLRNADGTLMHDSDGNPVLECMCGNILSGRVNPGMPFFTAHGSFWTNSTTQLLASTTEADRQGRTRNRCNGAGYESVALLPMRVGDTTFGLLQLNDKRKDRFSPRRIATLERLADSLAVAVAHRNVQRSALESEGRYRTLVENIRLGVALIDRNHRVLMANAARRRSLP